jgi:hypothetical protein
MSGCGLLIFRNETVPEAAPESGLEAVPLIDARSSGCYAANSGWKDRIAHSSGTYENSIPLIAPLSCPGPVRGPGIPSPPTRRKSSPQPRGARFGARTP